MQVPKNIVPSKFAHSVVTLIGTYPVSISRRTLAILFLSYKPNVCCSHILSNPLNTDHQNTETYYE